MFILSEKINSNLEDTKKIPFTNSLKQIIIFKEL